MKRKPMPVTRPAGYTEELKLGRTTLQRGERVQVRGSGNGKHDGFQATCAYAYIDAGGLVVGVRRENRGYRFVKPERIVRKRRQPGVR